MGIDAINKLNLRKISQIQGIQSSQNNNDNNSTQAASGSSSGSGNLVDRLNSMDNKLTQGGGVSLNDSMSGQSGAQDDILRKFKQFS